LNFKLNLKLEAGARATAGPPAAALACQDPCQCHWQARRGRSAGSTMVLQLEVAVPA